MRNFIILDYSKQNCHGVVNSAGKCNTVILSLIPATTQLSAYYLELTDVNKVVHKLSLSNTMTIELNESYFNVNGTIRFRLLSAEGNSEYVNLNCIEFEAGEDVRCAYKNGTFNMCKCTSGGNDGDYATKEELEELSQEKVDLNQGASNVGKMLVVGADGKLVLSDIPQSMGGDVIGFVDSSNNIVLSGVLNNGTYTVKYEYEDGTITEIGTIVVTDGVVVLTNLFIPSKAKINYRLNSSYNETSANGYFVSDHIEFNYNVGSKMTIKGLTYAINHTNVANRIVFFNASKTGLSHYELNTKNDSVYTLDTSNLGEQVITFKTIPSGTAYIRLSINKKNNLTNAITTNDIEDIEVFIE